MYKRTPNSVCSECRKEFYLRPILKNRQNKWTCSIACRDLVKRRESLKECLNCHVSFLRKHKKQTYCSHSCSNEARKGIKYTGERLYDRAHSAKVARKLVLESFPYECVWCGIGGEWNGKKIQLQVDHIDGNRSNNFLENLRLMCPNCHSQTDTWGSRKRKLGKKNEQGSSPT